MRYHQFSTFAFILILTILSILSITLADDENTGYKLCTSQICEEAGNEIIRGIDHSVEPCDDFYKHACGGWIKNHPIPENLETVNHFNILAMKSQGQLKEMLQENEQPDSETFRKVRDFYRSCNDLAAIDAKGLTPLEEIILANGGWPLTLPSKDWQLNQSLTLQKIHENYGKVAAAYALFDIDVYPDELNSSVQILRLKPSINPMDRARRFGLKRNKRDTVGTSHIDYMEAVAKVFARSRGFDVPSDNILRDVLETMIFEYALDELHRRGPESNDSSSYRVTTIAEVQNTWNSAISEHPEYAINWLETIRRAFEGTDIVIDETEKIGLTQGNIVVKIAELLKETPLRTVVNYVHWHAIDILVQYTNKEMRNLTNGILKHLYGYEEKDEERSITCISRHKMADGLSYIYVKKYFGGPVTTVIDMVSQIQAEMKREFDKSTWMDDEAKIRSKGKVDDMLTNIGYPSWYDEPGKMDEYYGELAVGSDYFENVVNFNRFKMLKTMKKLREPYSRYNAEWAFRSIEIGGFYTPSRNSVTIPAVIFQMPFYHAERPLVINYGSIGTLMGHEISHGFDDDGRKYDNLGNRKQWWSDSTITKFIEKADCYVDQYNKYTLFEDNNNKSIYVNGTRTLGENIADNTGISISLKAYLSYKKDHNLEDIRIPVLQNYTDQQLFFYSFSNYLCASGKPDVLRLKQRYSFHSTFPVRIKGALSNMPEFAQAFNCPSGSLMNPEKKCVLWD